MTPVTHAAGRTVALFGLGGSGLATARALAAGGCTPVCWDDKEASRDKARAEGLTVEDLSQADWSRFSSLILSPGVPLTHPKPHWTVDKARAAGVEIIGDIELFCRERAHVAPGAPLIAITGTNGKSTTTALTAHLVREAGLDAQMGGNIGTAVLDLDPPAAERVHVIECSSFQIDLTPSLAPTVGVLLNVTPTTSTATARWRTTPASRSASLPPPGPPSSVWTTPGAAPSLTGSPGAGSASCGSRWRARSTTGSPLRAQSCIAAPRARALRISILPASARCAGGTMRRTRRRPSPLSLPRRTGDRAGRRARHIPRPRPPHGAGGPAGPRALRQRQQGDERRRDREGAGVVPRRDPLDCGRHTEGGGHHSSCRLFRPHSQGLPRRRVERRFRPHAGRPCPHARCGTLDVALAAAAADAAQDDADEPVVLLSPACASYDQYPNFEVRGAHFRDLVRALPGVTPMGKA